MLKSLPTVIAFFVLCAVPCFASEEYDAAKATGTIKGVASFLGDMPRTILIPADHDCKKIREDIKLPPLRTEYVVVSADRKIANLVVYVSKGHEKYSYAKLELPAGRMSSIGCQYFPHVLALMTGQGMELESKDRVAHNWHFSPRENPEWNLSQPSKGIHDRKPKFETPELGIPVRCDVHGWTKGYICVFDHPFFDVTKDDGTFEIKLPPGEYELSFWHESPKKVVLPPPMKISVAADKPAEINVDVKDVNYHPNRIVEDNGK